MRSLHPTVTYEWKMRLSRHRHGRHMCSSAKCGVQPHDKGIGSLAIGSASGQGDQQLPASLLLEKGWRAGQ